jgi:hypothetical protein
MSEASKSPIYIIRSRNAQGAEPAQDEPVLIVHTTNSYTYIYDDDGTGAHMDVKIWRPTPTDTTFMILGDYAQGNYNDPSGTSSIVKVVNDDPNAPLIQPPKGYREVWNNQGAFGGMDGGVWFPEPPDDYIALGCVGQKGYNPPVIPNYACIRSDYCVDAKAGDLIWKDEWSGANQDCSIWSIIGLEGSFVAQGNYSPYVGPCHMLKPNS